MWICEIGFSLIRYVLPHTRRRLTGYGAAPGHIMEQSCGAKAISSSKAFSRILEIFLFYHPGNDIMEINSEDVFKMPRMAKAEYDRLVMEQYICRIAFKGERHPHIAPFLYVFDGRFMYFLSSNYGRKVAYFRDNPLVTVEIENYSPDLSHFSFVSLPGRLVQLEDTEGKRVVREKFVHLIKSRGLSSNVLSALGHSPEEPVEALLQGEKNSVWKLTAVNVGEIMGLKGHKSQPER